MLYHVTAFERERNKGQEKQLLGATIWRGREVLFIMTWKPSAQTKHAGVGEGNSLKWLLNVVSE